MRELNRYLIGLFLCCLLAGCADTFPADKIDPAGNLSRQDYLALRKRGGLPQGEEPPIPDMPDGLSEPPPIPDMPSLVAPALKANADRAPLPKKRVSVSLTEATPLRDVLIELGREGQINMEVDPRIEGGVIFSAHKQPFDVVLPRLCALAGLRYTVDGDFVRIEQDEPYQETYALDYPSLSRKTTSEVSIATNVFDVDVAGGNSSGTATRSHSGTDNNSVSKIAGSSDADFWSEVEKSLPHVLASVKKPIKAQKSGSEDNKNETTFSLDRQAGLVTVFGTSRQQEAVQSYLSRLKAKVTAQVLIEARIVEVELSDAFQSGVNWSALFKDTVNLAANFGAPGAGAAMTTASSGLFTAGLDTGDFTGILNLVRTFGTTRVLSSPRLTVLNNQTAVLKVARNEVYFLTSAQFPTNVNASGVATNGNPVFSSTPRTVPVGLVMTVQPAINSETGRVTMTLRPTISRVVDRVTDPSIGLNAAYANADTTVQSQIPVLAVREMDSVLQLQSGEVAVMGGLMQDSSENQDQGVPPFDSVPVLGNLAKSRDNQGKTSELVILLRATILKNPSPDEADTSLYRKYNRDPRPLNL